MTQSTNSYSTIEGLEAHLAKFERAAKMGNMKAHSAALATRHMIRELTEENNMKHTATNYSLELLNEAYTDDALFDFIAVTNAPLAGEQETLTDAMATQVADKAQADYEEYVDSSSAGIREFIALEEEREANATAELDAYLDQQLAIQHELGKMHVQYDDKHLMPHKTHRYYLMQHRADRVARTQETAPEGFNMTEADFKGDM